jgi:hypothetical protein
MNVAPYLTKLETRHHALEQELTTELKHPGSDPLRITELKRLKLKIKDQIVRLRERLH